MKNYDYDREPMEPSTEIYGYAWDDIGASIDPNGELTPEQTETAVSWIRSEIQDRLPDYATWIQETSSIILPASKLPEFDVNWNELKCDVFEDAVERFCW